MSIKQLLDPEMNKHDWNQKLRNYQWPSFPKYYEHDKNRRKQKQKKIEEISDTLEDRIQ